MSPSVRIDVDALLRAREEERLAEEHVEVKAKPPSKASSKKPRSEGSGSKSPKKRKSDATDEVPREKKLKLDPDLEQVGPPSSSYDVKQKLLLKLPRDPGPYPCCLCVSRDPLGLLRVHDPPSSWSGCQNVPAKDALGREIWRAHEKCATLVPETWVDEETNEDGLMEKVVFGVDGIVKGRWSLVRIAATIWSAFVLPCIVPEMCSVSEASSTSSWRSDTMHKGQMSEGIPYFVRPRRWRRKSCSILRTP